MLIISGKSIFIAVLKVIDDLIPYAFLFVWGILASPNITEGTAKL